MLAGSERELADFAIGQGHGASPGRSSEAYASAPRDASTRRADRARAFVFACCSAWAAPGHAAGGHFGVDDASILDVGQCQLETWWEHPGASTSLLHVGPACRVGPFELAVNADRAQGPELGAQTVVGPQLKWAGAVDDALSVGVVALAGWQGNAARYAGATLYVPISVRVASSMLAHVNVGRDWFAESRPRSRFGVALEWQATPAWSAIGEAFRQSDASWARIGVRWQPLAALSIDLSRARGIGATTAGWWTVGANWAFASPTIVTRAP